MTRSNRRSIIALVTALACSIALAQKAPDNQKAWPSRAVKLLVGFPAGSSPDLTARALSEPLGRVLATPVVVENHPGASGNLATDLVAKATDGHTLGIAINGNLAAARILNPRLPYDPLTDLALISLLVTAPLVLAAPANLPDGAAFFAAARAGASQWNYGSVGVGSVGHLGGEWLKTKAPGLQAVHVPFQGNPQIVNAMLAGQIHFALIPPGIAMPQVKAGRLRAIGLTGGRSTLVPEVPSLAEAGIKDFNLEVWNALIGPASLPRAAIDRLAKDVPVVMREPALRNRLFNLGWQAVGTSPEGLASRVRSETAILGAIIRERAITVQ